MKALSFLKQKIGVLDGDKMWANIDLPVDIRMEEAFLFQLKKLLISDEWGFDRRCIYVDVDSVTKILKVQKKEIVRASVVDGELSWVWDDAWKNWTELQDSAEMKALFEKISKMGTVGGKGKGKAKYGY